MAQWEKKRLAKIILKNSVVIILKQLEGFPSNHSWKTNTTIIWDASGMIQQILLQFISQYYQIASYLFMACGYLEQNTFRNKFYKNIKT